MYFVKIICNVPRHTALETCRFFFPKHAWINNVQHPSSDVRLTTAHACQLPRDKRWPNFQDGVSKSIFITTKQWSVKPFSPTKPNFIQWTKKSRISKLGVCKFFLLFASIQAVLFVFCSMSDRAWDDWLEKLRLNLLLIFVAFQVSNFQMMSFLLEIRKISLLYVQL